MNITSSHRQLGKRLITLVLAFALLISSIPVQPGVAAADTKDSLGTGDLTLETPALTVSGSDIVGGAYTKDTISNEKSYTLADLKAMTDLTETNMYSAINSKDKKSLFEGQGINLTKLLALSGYVPTSDKNINAIEMKAGLTLGYTATLNLAEDRYYFPNVSTGSEEGKTKVAPILAWADGGKNPDVALKDLAAKDIFKVMVGQTDINDVNNSLYNKGTNFIAAGSLLKNADITIDGKAYSRAEMLMQPRAEKSYTYETKKGMRTDTVRGVPLAIFAGSHAGDEKLTFTAADKFDNEIDVDLATAIEKNYMIAYETKDVDNNYSGIFNTIDSTSNVGYYFVLYGDEISPVKVLNNITIAPKISKYKHIDNGGQAGSTPYKIDAITSATLTVEGPGVTSTTPIRVGDLEATTNSNIHKGLYTDYRNGTDAKFNYEGVKVKSIIDGLVNTGVNKVDENVKVVFKNRWRQDVATISYQQLAKASTPIILAYGTGTEDESTVAPFVFDKAPGIVDGLGNDDGCLKLVYNKEDSALGGVSLPAKFSSVAYLYIERGENPPGFKHTTATNEAYKNVANIEQLVTFTGSKLGREVNYTVEDLEKMVEYGEDGKPNSSLGYRGSYGLSNTTYWYVNEYEGVNLWELLTQKLGINAETYKNDDSTLVSFAAWDNYKTQAQFSMKQLANPDSFYFYEKSPLDVGTTRPTKAQLATADYQPDNQGEGWTKDANGYPVKKGYPVVLAYGVNGYPYVRSNKLPGYAGGLGNDGGPMKVIFGKTDGMNRKNPDAVENYAYFYNNGSNQLQRAQEIYVGDDTRYSTHTENPTYQSMKDTKALTVEVKSNGQTTPVEPKTYTLKELENILYGSDVSKLEREGQGRQEKGYYAYKQAESVLADDLFEGVNLDYLLTEDVKMPGVLGKVYIYSGDSQTAALELDLADLKQDGYNSKRGTEGLGSMLAFAKNGYPLVANSTATGYVETDAVTNKAIQNSDGPLMFVRAQTASEKTAGVVGQSGQPTVANVTKIVVELEPDVYAHIGADYQSYATNKILFKGAIKTPEGVTKTVGDLEKLQKYMVTDTYTVGGQAMTYRGLDLKQLLADKDISASALMNELVVKNNAGQETTISVADLASGDNKIILAYGIQGAAGTDPVGKPLVPTTTDSGYDIAYKNAGGPLRLIINNKTAAECLENVTEITVNAATLNGWKHTTGNYASYANDTLAISGTGLKENRTFTVSELENLADSYKLFDKYKMGNDYYFEGIDLLKLLRDEIGFSGDLESSSITVYAKDNYAVSFTADQLKNGINGLPMMLAYGQGTSADKGLPLVDGDDQTDIRPGFDANIGNGFGPLRMVVNDNTGWCNKWVTKIVVGSEGGTEPSTDAVFSLSVNGVKKQDYTLANLKKMTATTAEYTQKGGTKVSAKGVPLATLIEKLGITNEDSVVDLKTIDNFQDGTSDKAKSYWGISLKEAKAKNYLLAYSVDGKAIEDDVKDAKTHVRIYRNHTEDTTSWLNELKNISGADVTPAFFFKSYLGQSGQAGSLPVASIRSTATDSTGGLWVGTNGGGAHYKPANSETFTINTLSTDGYKLASDFVQSITPDANGGVWFSQSKTYNPGQDGENKGAAYLDKDGKITYFNKENNQLPNNYVQDIKIDKDGNVWFASFDGITKYNPAKASMRASAWQTWKKADGLPAASVNTIAFDNKGGVWLGCYPDFTDIAKGPFTGGYAYLDSTGKITPYPSGKGETIDTSRLADSWVRDIALDNKGGAWVVRSGSYDTLANQGGRVDYVAASGEVTHYLGKKLVPDLASAPGNMEIRTVEVDKSGNIWFGTSGLGVYKLNSDLTIKAHVSSNGFDWPANAGIDNIYVLNIAADGTMQVGSNVGIVLGKTSDVVEDLNIKYDGGSGGGDTEKSIGDSNENDCDLAITGSVKYPGYFSIKGLKNYKGVVQATLKYDWLNSYGTKGTVSAQGVTLDNLLKDVMTLDSKAKSITIKAADGYERSFSLDSDKYGVYWKDKDGNKMMLAWKQDGKNVDLTLIIGQGVATDENKPMWVSKVAEIVVNDFSTSSGSGTPGKNEGKVDEEKNPDGTLKIAPFSKDPTIKYIKGYEGGSFRPNAEMTRGEAIAMFFGLLEQTGVGSKTYTSSFSDVKEGAWYANAIGYMEQCGVLKGGADGSFRPNDSISRAELVTIAVRLSGLQEEKSNAGFKDVNNGFWASNAIGIAAKNKWVNGYENGDFRPNANITRAEVVAITNRMVGREADMGYIKDNLPTLTGFSDVPTDFWAYGDIMNAANGQPAK